MPRKEEADRAHHLLDEIAPNAAIFCAYWKAIEHGMPAEWATLLPP
jgi:hypothetical protein